MLEEQTTDVAKVAKAGKGWWASRKCLAKARAQVSAKAKVRAKVKAGTGSGDGSAVKAMGKPKARTGSGQWVFIGGKWARRQPGETGGRPLKTPWASFAGGQTTREVQGKGQVGEGDQEGLVIDGVVPVADGVTDGVVPVAGGEMPVAEKASEEVPNVVAVPVADGEGSIAAHEQVPVADGAVPSDEEVSIDEEVAKVVAKGVASQHVVKIGEVLGLKPSQVPGPDLKKSDAVKWFLREAEIAWTAHFEDVLKRNPHERFQWDTFGPEAPQSAQDMAQAKIARIITQNPQVFNTNCAQPSKADNCAQPSKAKGSNGQGKTKGASNGQGKGKGASEGQGKGKGASKGRGKGKGASKGQGKGKGASKGHGKGKDAGKQEAQGQEKVQVRPVIPEDLQHFAEANGWDKDPAKIMVGYYVR